MRCLSLVIPLFLTSACGRGLPTFGPPIEAPPVLALPSNATVTAAVGDMPDVSATLPLNDAINVACGQQLGVTFNEPMDPATLTTHTFSLMQGSVVVAGAVSYDADSKTATFIPTVPLTASLPYEATIGIDAKSAPGRDIPAPFSWTFTTR